jgi:hypothetical protein
MKHKGLIGLSGLKFVSTLLHLKKGGVKAVAGLHVSDV